MIKQRKTTEEIIESVLKYTTFVLGAVAATLPIIVVFFAAFKTPEEFASSSAIDVPNSFFNLTNFVRAIVEGNMMIGFFNTAFILIVAMTGAIFLNSMVAYVMTRFDFKGKKLILFAFLLATLVPAVTQQVATFQIVKNLGLFNTRLSVIVLYMGSDIISIYIFMQFLNSVSKSLDESAMLDGASYLMIYRRIILPLLKPAIVTVLIVKGVQVYNDFYMPFLYMPKAELQVISTSLFKFQGPYGSQWEVISAGIMVSIIPTLGIFLALQKYIYNGFTAGSVK